MIEDEEAPSAEAGLDVTMHVESDDEHEEQAMSQRSQSMPKPNNSDDSPMMKAMIDGKWRFGPWQKSGCCGLLENSWERISSDGQGKQLAKQINIMTTLVDKIVILYCNNKFFDRT